MNGRMRNLALLVASIFLYLGSFSMFAEGAAAPFPTPAAPLPGKAKTATPAGESGLAGAKNFGEFAERYRLSREIEEVLKGFLLSSVLTKKPVRTVAERCRLLDPKHQAEFENARRKEDKLVQFLDIYKPSSGRYKPADTVAAFVAQYELLPALGATFGDAGVKSAEELIRFPDIFEVLDVFDVAHYIAGKSSFLGLESLAQLGRGHQQRLRLALEFERVLRPMYHEIRATGFTKIAAPEVGPSPAMDTLETPILRLRTSWANRMERLMRGAKAPAPAAAASGYSAAPAAAPAAASGSSAAPGAISEDGGFRRLIAELSSDQKGPVKNMCLYDESRRAELVFHYMDRFLNHYFGEPLSGAPKNGDFTWGYIQKWQRLFGLLYDVDQLGHPHRYEIEAKEISRAEKISYARDSLYDGLSFGIYPLPVSGPRSNELFRYSSLKDWFLAGIAPVSIELGGDEKVALLLGHPIISSSTTDGAFTLMRHDLLHINTIMGPNYAHLRLRDRRQCGLFRQCSLSLTDKTTKYNISLFYLKHEFLDQLKSAFAKGEANLRRELFEFALELVLEREISRFPLFLGENSLLGNAPRERGATCWSVDQLDARYRFAIANDHGGPLDVASKAETAFLWELESADGPGGVVNWRDFLSKLNIRCKAEMRRKVAPLVLVPDNEPGREHSELKKRVKGFALRKFPEVVADRVRRELKNLDEIFAKSRLIPECVEIFELKAPTADPMQPCSNPKKRSHDLGPGAINRVNGRADCTGHTSG